MRYIIAIILFPFIWVILYLYRILWSDIFLGILDLLSYMLSNTISFIIYLILLPISIILDVFIGLFVTFFVAMSAIVEFANGSNDALASGFATQNNRLFDKVLKEKQIE